MNLDSGLDLLCLRVCRHQRLSAIKVQLELQLHHIFTTVGLVLHTTDLIVRRIKKKQFLIQDCKGFFFLFYYTQDCWALAEVYVL